MDMKEKIELDSKDFVSYISGISGVTEDEALVAQKAILKARKKAAKVIASENTKEGYAISLTYCSKHFYEFIKTPETQEIRINIEKGYFINEKEKELKYENGTATSGTYFKGEKVGCCYFNYFYTPSFSYNQNALFGMPSRIFMLKEDFTKENLKMVLKSFIKVHLENEIDIIEQAKKRIQIYKENVKFLDKFNINKLVDKTIKETK